jgi:hypothetical protein
MRVDETKTAAGRRVIPLPAFAIAVLNQVAELPDRERSTATQGRR